MIIKKMMLVCIMAMGMIPGSAAYLESHSKGQTHMNDAKGYRVDRISAVTILVRDQDEALRWYIDVLGFELRHDDAATMQGFRWLTVGPRGQKDLEVVLLPAGESEMEQVGKGTIWVIETEDCRRAYREMSARGVKFEGEPAKAPWGGISTVFYDLYGNAFNLVQRVK